MGSSGNLEKVGWPHSMKVLNKGLVQDFDLKHFVEIWNYYSGGDVLE